MNGNNAIGKIGEFNKDVKIISQAGYAYISNYEGSGRARVW